MVKPSMLEFCLKCVGCEVLPGMIECRPDPDPAEEGWLKYPGPPSRLELSDGVVA